MPDYNNNGLPTNAVQPEPTNNNTLPGLDDSSMYQSQESSLQVSQQQNQIQPQQQDKIDDADQIREGELKEEERQREILDKAISKALAIHQDEFLAGEFEISKAKVLTRPGKDRADTAELSISTRDGLDFQMYFDDEGSLVMENHRNDISQNMVGGKYLDPEHPEMDLSTPEKQEMYLSEIDKSETSLELKKEEMELDIKEMGFLSKEDMQLKTGVDVDEELSHPEMSKDDTKQNIAQQTTDSILKNATMVVDGNTKFDTYRTVNDVLQTQGAQQIVAVGSDVYTIDNQGNAKLDNGIRVQGPNTSVKLQQNGVVDTRIGQTFTTLGNPNEGVGVGTGGAPQAVKGLNDPVAMSHSLNEGENMDSAKKYAMFEKAQDQTDHAEQMHFNNGTEDVGTLHTDNDVTGKELSAIADKYGMKLEKVEEMYHNNIAKGMTMEAAMDKTRTDCDEEYSEAMHEPDLEPRSPFDPPNPQ